MWFHSYSTIIEHLSTCNSNPSPTSHFLPYRFHSNSSKYRPFLDFNKLINLEFTTSPHLSTTGIRKYDKDSGGRGSRSYRIEFKDYHCFVRRIHEVLRCGTGEGNRREGGLDDSRNFQRSRTRFIRFLSNLDRTLPPPPLSSLFLIITNSALKHRIYRTNNPNLSSSPTIPPSPIHTRPYFHPNEIRACLRSCGR